MVLKNIYDTKEKFFETYDEESLKQTYGVPTGIKLYDSVGNVLGNHPKAEGYSVILSLNGNSGFIEDFNERGYHSLALAMDLAHLDENEIKVVDSVLKKFKFKDAHCGKNLNDAPKSMSKISTYGHLVDRINDAETCMRFCMSDDEFGSNISDKDRYNLQTLIKYK